jgi:hypothetical protein
VHDTDREKHDDDTEEQSEPTFVHLGERERVRHSIVRLNEQRSIQQ